MTDPNTTTQTTGAAQAPSSYEGLVWTLRHFSDCKRQQNFHATADLLAEAADALIALTNRALVAEAERDAAVRAQQIADRDRAVMKEHAEVWRKEADMHLTAQKEQVTKRRAAEEERDAAVAAKEATEAVLKALTGSKREASRLVFLVRFEDEPYVGTVEMSHLPSDVVEKETAEDPEIIERIFDDAERHGFQDGDDVWTKWKREEGDEEIYWIYDGIDVEVTKTFKSLFPSFKEPPS